MNKNLTHFIWTLFGLIILTSFAIGTTRISNNLLEYTDNGWINISNSQTFPSFYLMSGVNEDSAGATNRTKISFYSSLTSDDDRRGLSIETHYKGSTQPAHVSLYSRINNNTDSRAIQWFWGDEDSDGKFYLVNLNNIIFPENFTGYYFNSTKTNSGLTSQDESFDINLDSNKDDTSEIFNVFADSNSSNILFQVNRNTVETKIATRNIFLSTDRENGDVVLNFYDSTNNNWANIFYDKASFPGTGNYGFVISNHTYINGDITIADKWALDFGNGTNAAACSVTTEGQIIYNNTLKAHCGCNGTAWYPLY